MSKKMTSGYKKIIALGMAAVILTVTVIGGTFAWTDYRQHKTNEFKATGKIYDVTLIEEFIPKDDWKVTDACIEKEVRVKNMLNPDDAKSGPVLVRLTFKEYMEIAAQTGYVYTPDRYAVGEDGAFIGSLTEPTEQWLANQGYPNHEYAQIKDAISGVTAYFIKTKAGDINGQYGKYIVTDTGVPAGAQPVIQGSVRADVTSTAAHIAGSNDECNYPAHNLASMTGDLTLPIREFVTWDNGAAVIPLSALQEGQTGVWVYNDTDVSDTYVYWVGLLRPGQTTADAFESVGLIKQPDGTFYYAIHVDMEAISPDELPTWTSIPASVKAALEAAIKA
ncbi:MAG: hypothetical protein LBN30_06080 [Oscillospiraceae bacterium]|jgi:hypothetical protein|nr:hypothetical protein [Oscillospiraceae bacterium]